MTESLSSSNSTTLETIPHDGIIQRIGNTPLLRIRNDLFQNISPEVRIFAKAEFANPGGSVKDRPAWNMIRQAILDGDLQKGQIIIDASSGNTGIALAMVGASLGYKVKICIPKNATAERLSLLRAYGAELELTDPLEGTDGAIMKAREIVQENPDDYFYVDQYNNENNWKAHYETTAEEILSQTKDEITHFVTGLGTSGTFIGITRRLKEENPEISCISMQPDTTFHGLEGLKHMETAIRPDIYNENLADENITISTSEAQQMTVDLARKEGILVGVSTGANLVAVGKIAENLDHGTIVTILCDRGERYLSDKFWEKDNDN